MKRTAAKIIGFIFCVNAIFSCSTDDPKTFAFPKEYDRIQMLRIDGKLNEAFSAIDSIRKKATPENDFQAYADALSAWCYPYINQSDSALYYALKARNHFSKLTTDPTDRYSREVHDMDLIRVYCTITTQRDSALILLNDCIDYYKSVGDIRNLIKACQYSSEIYRDKGDLSRSLSYQYIVEDICDTVKVIDASSSWIIGILSDVANIATDVGDFRLVNNAIENATRFYDKARPNFQSYYLYHRARTHLYQGEYVFSAYTAERLEKLALEHQCVQDLASGFVIHGLAHARMNELDKAIECTRRLDSLVTIHKWIGAPREKIILDGEIALLQGNYAKAHDLLFDTISRDPRVFPQGLILQSHALYYRLRGDYQNMLNVQQRQKNLADSLSTYVMTPNEFHKVERNRFSANSLRGEVDSLRHAINVNNQNQHIERIISVIVVIIAIASIIYQARRVNRQYKRKVEQDKLKLQKDLADKISELKRQEDMMHVATRHLSESIAYAEHIQRSILPQPEALEMCDITGSFIFFSPLDIVSGDFYWFAQKGDHLIVCCADCTGHGIPGAFMSMIASTIISDICNRSAEDIKPSQILEELDAALIDVLGHNKSKEGRAKDGCDISIASIDTKTKVVNVSSARRPVIVIKDQEMIDVKGTKRSIGDIEPSIRERKFEDTEIQLHTNDTIYMFSDGYSDQFGGQNNSRLNVKNIKRFLRATHNDDMDEQCLTMQDFFTQWKGDIPQTDDVLFIGIMI